MPLRITTAAPGVLVGLAAFLFGGISYCYHLEDQVSIFASHGEAASAGAVRSGWLPPFVPSSATAIRGVRNLDTDRQWLRFTVSEQDARMMVSGMKPLPYAEARSSTGKPPRWRGSWPAELQRPVVATPRGDLGFFRDPSPRWGARCVAVEWAPVTTVYAWSC